MLGILSQASSDNDKEILSATHWPKQIRHDRLSCDLQQILPKSSDLTEWPQYQKLIGTQCSFKNLHVRERTQIRD